MYRLRKDYHTLLVEHPDLSLNVKKDIDSMLWKTCYYRQIEEFRASIKKTTSIIENANDIILTEKATAHLSKLTVALMKFLADAISSYQDLLLQYESKIKGLKWKNKNIISNEIGNAIIQNIHRCLLHLGDLTRYNELHSELETEETQKNYIVSQKYYERASFIFPKSGNPYNQLSILASYSDNYFLAIFYYYRSILCEQSFTNGIENLTILYDKLIKNYNILIFNYNKKNKNVSMNLIERKKLEIENKSKIFLINILKLHKILFNWSNKLKTKQNDSDFMIDINNFQEEMSELMLNFDELLNNQAFSEAILLKLISLSIFSIHYSSIESIYGNESIIDQSCCTIGESLGLILLFNLINKYVSLKIIDCSLN